MKPHEFANCTYREAFLFYKSYEKERENKLKHQVILMEKMSDKLIKMYPDLKSRKMTRIIDGYEELFNDEYVELIKQGKMAPKTEEHQKMFVEMVIEDIKNNESG
jgi:hypothetical protein